MIYLCVFIQPTKFIPEIAMNAAKPPPLPALQIPTSQPGLLPRQYSISSSPFQTLQPASDVLSTTVQ